MNCPNCGTPVISRTAEFCASCGSRLYATVPVAPTGTANKTPWAWPLAAAAIVVLAMIAVGVGAFVVARGNDHGAAAPASATSTPTPASRHAAPYTRTKTVTRLVPPPTAPRYPPQPVDAVTPVDPGPYMDSYPNAYFVSPSQNIGCYIFNDGTNSAQCTIARYYWDEPGPDCPNGAVVQVDGTGTPSFVSCAAYPPYPDNSRILPYRYSLTNGQFSCTSAEAGISCTNRGTGTGFTLSREAFITY